MHRLIIELPLEKFGKLDGEKITIPIQKLKSLETLHSLRIDQEEFATICRIRLENPNDKVEDVFNGEFFEVTPLITEATGSFVCFLIERRPERARYLMNSGVYFPGPYEIRDGVVKFGVMGENKQLLDFMKQLEDNIPEFKVTSVTKSEFLTNSPLENLTEKQRQALSEAFLNGYYDLPRKSSSEELARKMGLDSSTFIEHRRKAEQRLMKSLFSK